MTTITWHSKTGRGVLVTGALFVVALILLPLFGLLAALFNPPLNPFIEAPPTLAEIFGQSNVPSLLWSTVSLALVVSVLAGSLGTWLAWVEQRANYRGVRFLSLLCLLPLAMPSYILAATLRESLGPGGSVGQLFNFPMFTGFMPTVLVLTLITVPYVQLLVSAVLTRLSVSEEEAARSLGASNWQVFQKIILPRLRPSLAFAILIVQLYVISDFGAVAVLDYPALTWRLYQAIDHQQLAHATLLGTAVLSVTVLLLLIARMVHGRVQADQQISQPRLPQRRCLSKRMLYATYAVQAFVIGGGVLLPVFTLSQWVLGGVLNDLRFASLWVPLRDTAWAASMSGVVIVVLAAWPAWIAARGSKRIAWMVEQGTYLTSALPGVLLAFGLMLAALFLSRGLGQGGQLYQLLLGSGVLLIVGYTMRFLAEAYAGLKTAILLLDPRLQDSARLLGASRWRWFSKVTLPALAPGIAAAFVLIVLSVVKELPVTLLLGSAMGLRTLSFRVFDRYQEAFLHDAGLAGLVLLLIAFMMVCLTLRWRRHV